MKNKLLYLMLAAVFAAGGVAALGACSSDDNDVKKPTPPPNSGWEDLEGWDDDDVDDANNTVKLESADIVPEVRIVNDGGRPYMAIGGGTFSATVEGYDMSDPADKTKAERKIAAAIREQYYLVILNNPVSGVEGYDVVVDNTHSVGISEGDKFEVRCDLSDLNPGAIYGVRFVKLSMLGEGAQEGDYDFNDKNFPEFKKLETTTAVVGIKRYDAFYKDENSGHEFDWDCLAIAVSDATPTLENKSVSLMSDTETDKVYLVVNGEYKYYDEDDLKVELAKIKGDYRYDVQLGNSQDKDVPFTDEGVTYTVSSGNFGGVYEIKIELTDFTLGTAFFHLDFADGTTNLRLPIAEDGITRLELEDQSRRIVLTITENTGTSYGWADGLVAVRITDTSIKAIGKADPVAIQKTDDRAYLVVTGECSGYTAAEIKDMIEGLDFEPSHGDNTKIVADLDDVTVAIENGKYVIKYDITSLKAVRDGNGGFGGYWAHLKPFGSGDNGEGNIGNENGVEAVKVGDKTYSYSKYDFSWGSRYLLTVAVSVAAEKAEFIADEDKIYYAVTFVAQNVSQSEIEQYITRIDLQPTTGNRIVYDGDKLVFGTMSGDGKITVSVDVTALGADVYIPHYFTNGKTGDSDGVDICIDKAVAAESFGGKTYEVKSSTTSWGWTAYLINVTQAAE